MKFSPGIIEAGCDFLRLSCPHGHKDLPPWKEKFLAERTKAAYEGQEPHQFSMMGIHFEECGDVAVGINKERTFLQAAGPIAHTIMEDMQHVPYTAGVTRADTQITAYPGEGEAAPLPRHFLEYLWSEEKGNGLRRRTINLWEAKEQGDTLYIGSPDSANRIRYYHAGIKHPDRYPVETIRWEVQHNKRCAGEAFRMMRASSDVGLCAASMVRGTLDALEIRDWWYMEVPNGAKPKQFRKSTKEGTLLWLKSSVGGAFRRACREGWGDEAIEALGIESLSLESLEILIATLEREVPKFAPKEMQKCRTYTKPNCR